MLKFCSLASGSSGNCLFVSSQNTKILIDCGISGKKTSDLLSVINEDINLINALIITHEHIDHLSGAGVLSRKYKIPVYIKEKALINTDIKIDNTILFNDNFTVGDIKVNSFSTYHDAADPIGYIISSGTSKIAIATDTGVVTREMYKNFSGCNFAFIESNHDVGMLTANPNYTFNLKQRILSEKGHLSNKMCADLACTLVSDGVKNIMLGHISNENNTPEIAYETTHSALLMSGFKDNDFNLYVAARNNPSKIIEI